MKQKCSAQTFGRCTISFQTQHKDIPTQRALRHNASFHTAAAAALLYLHGEGGRLLVVVVEGVGHEGGVVGQPLAHAQRDGLAGEQVVAARRRVHGDGHARRQHGHGQRPQQVHGGAAGRNGREAKAEGRTAARSGGEDGRLSGNQRGAHPSIARRRRGRWRRWSFPSGVHHLRDAVLL